jgi:hypothetical protein
VTDSQDQTLGHAIKALTVLRDRKRASLVALEGGDIEEFLATSRNGRIAYQNFLSLDARASKKAISLKDDPEARALGREIIEINGKITEFSKSLLASESEKLEKLGKAVAGIRHYGRTHNKANFVMFV